MLYAGLDVHKMSIQVAVLDAKGTILLRCDSQLADSPQLGGRMAPTGSNIATIVLDYARIR